MEYITIAEYAKIKKISVQAVYKKCDTSLKEYVKAIDGKKMISAAALTAEERAALAGEQTAAPPAPEENPYKEMAELLKAELAERNKQIAAQDARIAELTEAVMNLTGALQAAQALHAGTISERLSLNDGNQDTGQDAPPEDSQRDTLEPEPASIQPQDPPERVTLFERIKRFFS